MGFWWFGRKSAPPDMRPFVTAWLNTAEAEEGFARSCRCSPRRGGRALRRPDPGRFWRDRAYGDVRFSDDFQFGTGRAGLRSRNHRRATDRRLGRITARHDGNQSALGD